MSKAIAISENVREMVPSVEPNPMTMIAAMIERGTDMSQLERMLSMQERWEGNEARKAFFAAKAQFSAHPPKVIKDKANSQYNNSKYSSLENTVNPVKEELSKYGLSTHWEVDQANRIAVTCIMSHEKGHSERVTISGPPDNSGKKNDLQQIKSTLTYLKLATFEAITGTASEVGSLNDDGNSAAMAHNPDNDPASNDQMAMIQDYRDAGAIPEATETWINKKSPLTVKQAGVLLTKLKKASSDAAR